MIFVNAVKQLLYNPIVFVIQLCKMNNQIFRIKQLFFFVKNYLFVYVIMATPLSSFASTALVASYDDVSQKVLVRINLSAAVITSGLLSADATGVSYGTDGIKIAVSSSNPLNSYVEKNITRLQLQAQIDALKVAAQPDANPTMIFFEIPLVAANPDYLLVYATEDFTNGVTAAIAPAVSIKQCGRPDAPKDIIVQSTSLTSITTGANAGSLSVIQNLKIILGQNNGGADIVYLNIAAIARTAGVTAAPVETNFLNIAVNEGDRVNGYVLYNMTIPVVAEGSEISLRASVCNSAAYDSLSGTSLLGPYFASARPETPEVGPIASGNLYDSVGYLALDIKCDFLKTNWNKLNILASTDNVTFALAATLDREADKLESRTLAGGSIAYRLLNSVASSSTALVPNTTYFIRACVSQGAFAAAAPFPVTQSKLSPYVKAYYAYSSVKFAPVVTTSYSDPTNTFTSSSTQTFTTATTQVTRLFKNNVALDLSAQTQQVAASAAATANVFTLDKSLCSYSDKFTAQTDVYVVLTDANVLYLKSLGLSVVVIGGRGCFLIGTGISKFVVIVPVPSILPKTVIPIESGVQQINTASLASLLVNYVEPPAVDDPNGDYTFNRYEFQASTDPLFANANLINIQPTSNQTSQYVYTTAGSSIVIKAYGTANATQQAIAAAGTSVSVRMRLQMSWKGNTNTGAPASSATALNTSSINGEWVNAFVILPPAAPITLSQVPVLSFDYVKSNVLFNITQVNSIPQSYNGNPDYFPTNYNWTLNDTFGTKMYSGQIPYVSTTSAGVSVPVTIKLQPEQLDQNVSLSLSVRYQNPTNLFTFSEQATSADFFIATKPKITSIQVTETQTTFSLTVAVDAGSQTPLATLFGIAPYMTGAGANQVVIQGMAGAATVQWTYDAINKVYNSAVLLKQAKDGSITDGLYGNGFNATVIAIVGGQVATAKFPMPTVTY